jgi:O-antigen ligase
MTNPATTGQARAEFPPWNTRLRPVHIRLYHGSNILTELLICFILVASPWAFGTTQPATVWTMNIAGFLLGALLLVKGFICGFRDYRPMKWLAAEKNSPLLKWLTAALAILSFLIPVYCLVAALNARSAWQISTNSFVYFDYISWLPHSYDRASTWQMFWNYSALAFVFWAMRDWLLGLTASEEQPQRAVERGVSSSFRQPVFVPARLRRLLWVLSVNGALLGLEGIVQRLSGTSKLLWFMPTHMNKEALDQFGPYAYRSNAAQYFNLLWPVVLGFWWALHRSGGFKRWRHHVLLVCATIMAACPVISTTRGGAIVTAGLIVSAAVFLFLSAIFFQPAATVREHGGSRRKFSPRTALLTFMVVCVFFAGASWLGLHFGWSELEPRMMEIDEGFAGREQIYETARQMSRDYPLFGTGPGTFSALFQLYRPSPGAYWPEQLHNDWLETRITFGWLGSSLIALAFLVVIARWFVSGGIHGGRRFVVLTWLALAGCLVHARYDFPFQIYSIVLLFVALCAVLFTLSRRAGK